MSKFILVMFSDQAKALEGVNTLRQLHRDGSITLYGTTVLDRDQGGTLSTKQRTDEGPSGAGVDLLVGALMGLFAGPLGVGCGAGASGLGDVIRVEVSDDLLESMERELTPGKFALVADLSEECVTHVDVRMGELGGQVVLREPRPLHFRAVREEGRDHPLVPLQLRVVADSGPSSDRFRRRAWSGKPSTKRLSYPAL